MNHPSTCKSCGAQIVWAKTAKGKNTPLDYPGQKFQGTFIILNGVAHSSSSAPDNGELKYTSHFATCPNAERHRKQRVS